MDTQTFIEAARVGGRALETAMRQLMAEEGARCYRRCARDLFNFRVSDHDIEDCVQETFLKAWRSASGFRGDSAVSTWLEIVRRSVVNDYRDKLKRLQEAPLEDAEGNLDPAAEKILNEAARAATDRPDLHCERRQLGECLARQLAAFGQRHPGDVTALHWIVIDGIGNEELAVLLKRSAGATREFKSQLLKKARAFFDICLRLSLEMAR